MYLEFFGLTALPFELTSDPSFLYMSDRHQEALAAMQYAIRERKGLTVLTGEVGLGKTVLIQRALARQEGFRTWAVVLKNPALTRAEFLEAVADGFKLGTPPSKTVLLRRLEVMLLGCLERGIRAAFVVDEAHVIPWDLLEEVRLLGNIETPNRKLLSIILAGQPELAVRLNDPSLRQLKQRVAVRCTLLPFSARETDEYIATRLQAAGGGGRTVFTPEAQAMIYQASQGVPRLINAICDNAMLSGFACGQNPVGPALVREVCQDLDCERGPEDLWLGSSTPGTLGRQRREVER